MSAKYKTRECEHIFKKLNLISTFPVTSNFSVDIQEITFSSRLDINYPGFRYLPQIYQFFDNLEQLCKLVRIPSILKINNACTIKTNAKWKNNYTMYIKNAFLKPLLFFIAFHPNHHHHCSLLSNLLHSSPSLFLSDISTSSQRETTVCPSRTWSSLILLKWFLASVRKHALWK